MTRTASSVLVKWADVVGLFQDSIDERKTKHWWVWHLANARAGRSSIFFSRMCSTIGEIDDVVPGFAKSFVERVTKITGLEPAKYEALMAACAELYVGIGMLRVADKDAAGKPVFGVEPGAMRDKKPEFVSRTKGIDYIVEVKCPDLQEHGRQRRQNDTQLNTRVANVRNALKPGTLPRDNPIKDFLVSAQEKFATYRSTTKTGPTSLLFIIWDDFGNEPIAALVSSASGLLTTNSFYRKEGRAVTFPDVDGVVVSRYQNALSHFMADEPGPDDETIPFQYHNGGGFPWKAMIQNPHGKAIPPELAETLDLTDQVGLGATAGDYSATDFVMWTTYEIKQPKE